MKGKVTIHGMTVDVESSNIAKKDDVNALRDEMKILIKQNKDLSDAIVEMIVNQEPRRTLWQRIKSKFI